MNNRHRQIRKAQRMWLLSISRERRFLTAALAGCDWDALGEAAHRATKALQEMAARVTEVMIEAAKRLHEEASENG